MKINLSPQNRRVTTQISAIFAPARPETPRVNSTEMRFPSFNRARGIARSGKSKDPSSYHVRVGGNSAAALFDIGGDLKMERTTALKKLRALLGKNMGWRVEPRAPSPEERAEAAAALPAAVAERDRLSALRQERYKAILEADAEYQRLVAAHAAASKVASNLSGTLMGRKFTVGVSNGMFFVVKAEGDSWEEVIATVNKAKAARTEPGPRQKSALKALNEGMKDL